MNDNKIEAFVSIIILMINVKYKYELAEMLIIENKEHYNIYINF